MVEANISSTRAVKDTVKKVYLVHFRQAWKYLDFARNELESLSSLFGVKTDELYVNDMSQFDMKVNPTCYVYLPNDEVCR